MPELEIICGTAALDAARRDWQAARRPKEPNMSDAPLAELARCLPDLRLLTEPGDLEHYGRDWTRRWTPAPLAIAFGCAMAGVATLLAVLTLSRGITAGIGMAILVAMYLGNIVAQIDTRFDVLATISAFHYFDATPIIDSGVFPWGAFALYMAVAVLGWVVALLLFRRRDLAV